MFRLLWCAAAFSRVAAVYVAAAFAVASAKVQKRRILSMLTLRTLRQKSEKKNKVRVSDIVVSRKCLISSSSSGRCWNESI